MSVQKYYADSMAFFGLQAQPPVFDPLKRPRLALAHLTSVPPFVKRFDKVVEMHEMFRAKALSNPDTHAVHTKYDLYRPGSMGIVLGIQHAPDGLTRHRVKELLTAGLHILSIAYDGRNEYGGGFKSNDGLSAEGVKLLKWMSDAGMLLDLSHANIHTARMALELIARENLNLRVLASHSACARVFAHARNLTDDLIFKIASLGGYIGIPAVTFLTAKEGGAYLTMLSRHIEHAVELTDQYNCVGIGSDCNHLDMTMDEARAHFERMKMLLNTNGSFGEYFPDRPPEIIERGASMFEIFERTLLERFSPEDTEDLCGKNFKTFLERSLPT